MKCVMLSFAALILGLPLTCFSEGQPEKTAGIITRDAFGFYHIDGNPESLDLKMADGGIVFSRAKAFHIGVTYQEKDFCWNDNGKILLSVMMEKHYSISTGIFCSTFCM